MGLINEVTSRTVDANMKEVIKFSDLIEVMVVTIFNALLVNEKYCKTILLELDNNVLRLPMKLYCENF